MAIDVEIVGLDPYGWRRRLSGMVGNRALGPRHERCEESLQLMLERLRLVDGGLPAVGRQTTDQMQEIAETAKSVFELRRAAARMAAGKAMMRVSASDRPASGSDTPMRWTISSATGTR